MSLIRGRKERTRYVIREGEQINENWDNMLTIKRKLSDRKANRKRCRWPECSIRARFNSRNNRLYRWDRDHCYCKRHYQSARAIQTARWGSCKYRVHRDSTLVEHARTDAIRAYSAIEASKSRFMFTRRVLKTATPCTTPSPTQFTT